MSEKTVISNKLHFLEVRDFTGDKIIINLENVNYLRVDNDELKILFKNDENEHILKHIALDEIEKLNKKRF